MPQDNQRPTPHGDPLKDVVEENPSQRQSDAPNDATAGDRDELQGTSDRSGGRGSSANGVPAFDDDDGEKRKQRYKDGASVVSRID